MEQLLWELQGHMPWGNCHGLAQASSTTAFPTDTFGDVALGLSWVSAIRLVPVAVPPMVWVLTLRALP